MNSTLKPPKTIYDVWESLPGGTLCQLINNNIVMSPAPMDVHQVILNEINIELSIFLRKNKIGVIRIAPYDVHLSKHNIFQPDLIFIANKNLKLIKAGGLAGAPDLVIEILSPATAHIDLGEKKAIYEQFGVREYFIVKPDSKKVDGFILRNKKFVAVKETTGVLTSELLQTTILF